MTNNESRDSEFIGRQPELAVLTAALDNALSGRGQMVMLAGEPGIGKTRLAQELASRAESLGAQVLWGWCYEHAGAPPYWPYVQPIRAYVESADPQQLRTQMGPGGSEIAEIVPELRAKLPDLTQPLAAEPEQARFRLFDSVATFLKNASQSQPMLFVVDDLHWADESSLLLLEFLTREIAASPVLILGTYRDVEVTGRHPLSQTLGNLVRERHFQRVQLGGLTRQEVGEFVEANAGVTLPHDALETIHNRTKGNPLFVNEVVQLIDPDNMTENRSWAEIIPEGVRDAIRRRLGRLSENCNQVLRTASVIGREFDFSLLRGLDSDIGAEGVLEALDEALEAKVIEALPARLERYQFGHALIQQALYEEMSPIRRVRAHARVGETLEQLHQSELDEHAAELAHHFAEAQSVLGTEKLVRYSHLAGNRALAAYAYEEALPHYQRAVLAKEGQVLDAETASLLFGLGRTQLATFGRHQLLVGMENLDRAFDYYAETGDVEHAVAVAEHPTPALAGYVTNTEQRIARALTMVPSNSPVAGRLLALHGRILGQEAGDYERSSDAFHRALVIAQRENDVALELRTLAGASFVDTFHCRWRECLEKTPRAIELAKSVDDPYGELLTRWGAVMAEIAMGHLDAARHHVAEGMRLAERLRDRFWLCGTLMRSDYVTRIAGDWQTARESTDRGLAILPTESRLLCARALLEYDVGEFEQGQACLQRLLETMRSIASGPTIDYGFAAGLLPLVGRITGSADRSGIAESAAETVLSSASATPLVAAFANTGLALLAVERGAVAAAREQHVALKPLQGHMLPQFLISVDRLLALLSHTMGDLDQSAAHFNDALDFCRKAGYRPELAWSCCDYAETLLESSGEGDRAKAMSLLDESLAISSDLGMRPLMERVGALREGAKAQPVRAPAYPDGLTQREIGVLQLICGGKTDREIGEELFISVKTVGNHVSNILNKTNTANRTEAATYAAHHGIVADEATG